MADQIIKIAVVGPESTGKSEMAEYLAQELDTFFVPEYARYYCEDLHGNYTLQDEMNMFYGQLALEDSLLSVVRQPLIICDTTFLTVKVWSDHLFGYTPERVLEELSERVYHHYLLMDIDLPWEDDPLRDFPDKREHFMKVWKEELNRLEASFDIISGTGVRRFQAGLSSVRSFLKSGKIYGN